MSTVHQKPIPYFLKALGRKAFPQIIELPGGHYNLEKIFKHDFFAATGLYRRQDGQQVVLKIGRWCNILGLPGAWIGRWLTNREANIYQMLQGVTGIPAYAGRWGQFAFAHEHIPGHSLRRDEKVGDRFFEQLARILDQIHSRRMAYVDLEKCSNILVGDDGRPYLIDFQISWFRAGWLLNMLQHMDRYHLLKHRRRIRPDQVTVAEENSFEPPFYIKLHRAIVKPLQKIRRGALKKLDPNHASSQR